MRRGRWQWLVVAALSLAAPRAEAQSTSAARAKRAEGQQFLEAGKYAEACAAFDASQKLEPDVGTLTFVAACREMEGRLATASATFTDVRQQAHATGDAAREQAATNHIDDLAPRLSRLTISVPVASDVTDLEIQRDGEVVPRARWNQPVPVDGGKHTITARAPGRQAWTETREINPERDAQTVVIPVLPPGAPAESKIVASTARSYAVPIMLGSGALALGGVSLAFKLKGDSQYDKAKAEIQSQDRRDSLSRSATNWLNVARGFLAGAVVCAGAAVYFYVRDPGEGQTATAVAPVVSPGLAGLAVVGSW